MTENLKAILCGAVTLLGLAGCAAQAAPTTTANPAPRAEPPLVIVYEADTVRPGQITHVRAHVEPRGTRCNIAAWYPSGHPAAATAGLPEQAAPADGDVRWSWRIPARTSPGSGGLVDVTCTGPGGALGGGRSTLAVSK